MYSATWIRGASRGNLSPPEGKRDRERKGDRGREKDRQGEGGQGCGGGGLRIEEEDGGGEGEGVTSWTLSACTESRSSVSRTREPIRVLALPSYRGWRPPLSRGVAVAAPPLPVERHRFFTRSKFRLEHQRTDALHRGTREKQYAYW